MMIRKFRLALAILFLSTATAHADIVALDTFAGQWSIRDAAGREIGWSTIDVQEPGAMLHETRHVGDGRPQSLWFANMEHASGWTQLFVAPTGIREFATLSAPGVWPLVLGAQVRLQDGSDGRFRLTITRASEDSHHRLLELSRDGGSNWSTVLDYQYLRAGAR